MSGNKQENEFFTMEQKEKAIATLENLITVIKKWPVSQFTIEINYEMEEPICHELSGLIINKRNGWAFGTIHFRFKNLNIADD